MAKKKATKKEVAKRIKATNVVKDIKANAEAQKEPILAIGHSLAQQILDYLLKQPCGETLGMVLQLKALKTIKVIEQPTNKSEDEGK